jgi:hypothetical protein
MKRRKHVSKQCSNIKHAGRVQHSKETALMTGFLMIMHIAFLPKHHIVGFVFATGPAPVPFVSGTSLQSVVCMLVSP